MEPRLPCATISAGERAFRSILFPARNAVESAALPNPRAGPGEVVVKVHASGVCHTDFEVLRGNHDTSAFPVVPGHEYAGAIVEFGPEVTRLSVDGRVVVDPNVECGTCRTCRRGWAHLCEALGAYGVTWNGGFAERDLSEYDIAYLFVDGIAERIRPGQKREPGLAGDQGQRTGATSDARRQRRTRPRIRGPERPRWAAPFRQEACLKQHPFDAGLCDRADCRCPCIPRAP